MKRSPQVQRIVQRMASGVLSREGFLGTDPRPLEEVLDADRSAVAALGTTHGELAAGLGGILEKARAALGTPVQVGEGLSAVHREAMGRIPCPFGGCGTFPKGEVELAGTATGERLVFTALGVHLVAAHGFCGGRGSRYRLDPGAVARILRPGER